jgi:DNA-binding transcriptional regulator YiaG
MNNLSKMADIEIMELLTKQLIERAALSDENDINDVLAESEKRIQRHKLSVEQGENRRYRHPRYFIMKDEIKHIRQDIFNMSKEELVEKLYLGGRDEVTLKTIDDWENGTAVPTLWQFFELVVVFRFNVINFLVNCEIKQL